MAGESSDPLWQPDDMPDHYPQFAEPSHDVCDQAPYKQIMGYLILKHYGGQLTVNKELREEIGRMHTEVKPGKDVTVYESFRAPEGS